MKETAERKRRGVALAGLLWVTPMAALVAQSNISVVPTVGYTIPSGPWIDDQGLKLEPQGGVFLGLSAELGLNKNFSFAVYASRTLGALQGIDASIDTVGGALTFSSDMATTELAGMVILRPLGRLPSGAPKTVYLEAGFGFNSYTVSRGLQDPDDPSSLESFSYSTPSVIGGAGLSFPVGRRVTLQAFGRVNYQLSEYSSDFLDILTGVTGEKTMLLDFGVGLRVGR